MESAKNKPFTWEPSILPTDDNDFPQRVAALDVITMASAGANRLVQSQQKHDIFCQRKGVSADRAVWVP
jgi:hypothetical protein